MPTTSKALALAALLGILGALPAGALATTIAVTTTQDLVAGDGLCGLREAVSAANLNSATPGAGECPAGSATGSDTIRLGPGVYALTLTGPAGGEDLNASGDLDIRSSLSIVGAGAAATTIDARGTDRVLDLPSVGLGTTITLDGLTITGGVTSAGTPGAGVTGAPGGVGGTLGPTGGDAGTGAGIRNFAALTVIRSAIVGNVAGAGGRGGDATGSLSPNGSDGQPGGGGPGGRGGVGGIATAGSLSLIDSVVARNSGGAGGAGGTGSGGSSTGGLVGANGGDGEGGGGGVGGGGGIEAAGFVAITGSAITDNTSGSGGRGGDGFGGPAAGGGAGGDGGSGHGGSAGGGGEGGGVRAVGKVSIERTVVARNATGAGGQGGAGRGGPGAGAGSYGPGVGGRGGDGGTGGGIALFNQPMAITNATIASNTTGAGGGGGGGGAGIFFGSPGSTGGPGGPGGRGGGVGNYGGLTLVHATVAGNGNGGAGTAGRAILVSGPGSPGAAAVPGAGDGVYSEKPITTARTIVSANRCDGIYFVTDGGDNVAFQAPGCVGNPSDPRLGPLADNGGLGPSMRPAAGGSALDQAPIAGCPAVDQRGARRPFGPGCDIGAYEVSPPSASTGAAGNLTATSARIAATVEHRRPRHGRPRRVRRHGRPRSLRRHRDRRRLRDAVRARPRAHRPRAPDDLPLPRGRDGARRHRERRRPHVHHDGPWGRGGGRRPRRAADHGAHHLTEGLRGGREGGHAAGAHAQALRSWHGGPPPAVRGGFAADSGAAHDRRPHHAGGRRQAGALRRRGGGRPPAQAGAVHPASRAGDARAPGVGRRQPPRVHRARRGRGTGARRLPSGRHRHRLHGGPFHHRVRRVHGGPPAQVAGSARGVSSRTAAIRHGASAGPSSASVHVPSKRVVLFWDPATTSSVLRSST